MDQYESLITRRPTKGYGFRNKQRMATWKNKISKLQDKLLDKPFGALVIHRFAEPPDGKRTGVDGVTCSSIALWEQGRDSVSILQKKNHDQWRGMERRKILETIALKNKLHPRNKLRRFFGPKTRKHKGVAAGTRKRRKRRTKRRN